MRVPRGVFIEPFKSSPRAQQQTGRTPPQEEERLRLLTDTYVRRACGRRGGALRSAAMFTVLALSAVMLVPAARADGERAVKTPDRIPKIANEIRVDGVLDEDVWENALVMGVNNEVRPGYNIPAPVETDMLLAYDETTSTSRSALRSRPVADLRAPVRPRRDVGRRVGRHRHRHVQRPAWRLRVRLQPARHPGRHRQRHPR